MNRYAARSTARITLISCVFRDICTNGTPMNKGAATNTRVYAKCLSFSTPVVHAAAWS